MKIINSKHLAKATLYSLAGLKRAWDGEQAFRHETIVLGLMSILLVIMRPGIVWSLALISAWLFVMVVELLNSAIEEAFNIHSTEFHIRIKHGKDMASAAIFVAIIINILLWLAMLVDRFF